MRQVNKWLLGSLFAANAVIATQAIAQDTNLQVDTQASASISLDKNAIEATVPAAFKAAKQVVIGSFKVGFINYNKATAKSGGGFLSRDKESRVVLRSKLEGLAPEHMQAIVDDIYADFSAQLKNQGYEVLDRSTLTALPAFTSISGSPSPFSVMAFRWFLKHRLCILHPRAKPWWSSTVRPTEALDFRALPALAAELVQPTPRLPCRKLRRKTSSPF